jgi:hypothetical protein
MNTTTIESKEIILSELWMNYKTDPNFEDFISYNDLGLPLAYIMSTGIAKRTEASNKFIDETFTLLLGSLEVEDTGFDSLDDVFMASET